MNDTKLQQLKDSILQATIPQLVLTMISYALDSRASDVHVEPESKLSRIRYRVDGVLREIVEYPLNIHPAIVSRIKIMSNLKIDESRIPQDGRTEVVTKDGRTMDLRISTFPTVNGEKVVMRIQDKTRKIPELNELGIFGNSKIFLEEALKSPNGIVLNTGPTGSGKTTTLYSCLQALNTAEVNILTIEDPVEISMDGLNQSQIHPDISYTFAAGMRYTLRQDPDIIMVGEIRDRETADTAIEASLTGHLVLSTVHTNSAAETLTRIENLGVPNYLMASTIELIIAQRLIRRLCEKCRTPITPNPDLLKTAENALKHLHSEREIEPELLQKKQFYGPPLSGAGCEACDNIGYIGRVGIYEVMRMDTELKRMVLEKRPAIDIEQEAIKRGMVTLEQDGIIKSLKGVTSLDEVYGTARKVDYRD